MKKLFVMVLVSALCFSACEKKLDYENLESKSVKQIAEGLYFGKYTKELMVYDASGENSALVKIGTDNPVYFESLTTKNLQLIPVRQGQSSEEAVEQYYKENGLESIKEIIPLCKWNSNTKLYGSISHILP